jgi:hypothetical protein
MANPTQDSPASNSTDPQARLESFVSWFRKLDAGDQDALIKLVYNEYKIREVVSNFSTMSMDQRQTVFQRLGLPNELLSRIAPPSTTPVDDVEVEWKEWDTSTPS